MRRRRGDRGGGGGRTLMAMLSLWLGLGLAGLEQSFLPAFAAHVRRNISGVRGHQRRLAQQGDLLAQLEDAVLPVARRIEPWERERKGRIVPAPREPCRVV